MNKYLERIASKELKAIIIKGNPKYINNPLAKNYYKEIASYLKDQGINKVEFDPGADFTRPSLKADMYIGHSKGTSRLQYMPPNKQKVFLQFGVPEGVIDPIDMKWQKEKWYQGTDEQPPDEHFMLIPDQKKAIQNIITKLKAECGK